jgi:voltage-gated potassium channel
MDAKTETPRLNLLNLLVIVLSVYVLLELLLSTFLKLSPETTRLLDYIDNGICIFFLLEFIVRFYKAEKKLQFMKWGWIDLLSSIPMLDYARAGRTFRLIRLLRIFRAFRSTRHLVNHLLQKKAQGTFAIVAVIALLMVIFSSIAIFQVETDPNSNIKTAGDAIWWAYVTITTVGYGDKYPVTTEGRIIAAFLMTTGVGLFGTFAGYVSSWFLSNEKKDSS